jgi:V-type H+-transporting ATPase subunit C
MKAELVRITKAAFADIFQAWTHLKALRIFVESVLRYGLPPDFISAVIKVCPHLIFAEVA